MQRPTTWDREIDCEGLLCPLPVLRAAKVLRAMPSGAVLRVRSTDGMAAIDLPHFCLEAGHVFLSAEQEGAVGLYLIRRGPVAGDPDDPADRLDEGPNQPAADDFFAKKS